VAEDRPLVSMMSLFQQALANGRLSGNIEDRRSTPWNAPALAAINRAYGYTPQPPRGFVSDEDLSRPMPDAPRAAPTPENNGVDDLFTRTPTYHTAPANWQDQEAMWKQLDARTKARNAATVTPGAAPNFFNQKTGAFTSDGSTNPAPSDGMSTQMTPQTMTPNPVPAPVDPTVWAQQSAPTQPMPAPSDATASPDHWINQIRQLFSF
jgi:hypothetical protein